MLASLTRSTPTIKGRACAEHAPGMAQERRRILRLEIADGRAREEAGPRQPDDRARQPERLREVGRHRQHAQAWIVMLQLAAPPASNISAEMSTGT